MKAQISIVGAGIVGLATARELAQLGHEVFVLESEPVPGHHATSRNSEVVHAGFYYPTGSSKALHCVRGRRLLEAYITQQKIPYRRIGKVVVAADSSEEEQLQAFLERGQANDVEGLELIGSDRLGQLEPQVTGWAALYSNATGIIDSHTFMQRLQRDFEALGGVVATLSPVHGGEVSSSGVTLEIGGDDPCHLESEIVINTAGMFAPQVSRALGLSSDMVPESRWVKGNYFGYQGQSPFERLIYPLPSADGLGIHATLDLSGRCRFGPDTEEVTGLDYACNEARRGAFAESISQYWPGIESEKLVPDYAGIRAKIVPPEGEYADFQVIDHRKQSVGVIGAYGIESPGLTAALSLAQDIAARVG